MSSSKQVILDKLRNADKSGELFAGLEKPAQDYPFVKVEGDLAEAFKKALELISGECHIVNSEQDFAEGIVKIFGDHKQDKLYATSDIVSLLEEKGLPVVTGDADKSEHPLSVSGCECLSARTGSVFVSSKTSEGRKTHSFAETHIIVAQENQLHSDIPDALEFVLDKYNGSLPSAITMITGQSRTADIEKTLILGAHGPKELIVFIIRNGE